METDRSPGNPLDQAAKGKARRVAFLRFLAFTALSIGLVVVFSVLMQQLGENADLSLRNITLVQVMTAGVILFATGVMIRATREPATYFGWGKSGRLRQFAMGAASGLGLMTLMLGAMMALGCLSFGRRHWTSTAQSRMRSFSA